MTAVVGDLEGLCAAWLANKVALDRATEVDRDLKAELRRRARELPFEAGAASVTVHGVVVTRSEDDPAPPLRAGLFLERAGAVVFARVLRAWLADARVPSGAFDAGEFERCVAEELCSRADLLDSLGAPPKPREWAVAKARGG